MAAFTSATSFWSSADATNQTTGSFTPAPNDLLLVFAALTGCVVPSPAIVSAGLGWELIAKAVYGPDVHTLYAWVATSLAPPGARTVNVNCSPTTATSIGISVLRTSGLYKAGRAAIRQVAVEQNGAAAGTPTVVFANAVLTGNPYWSALANLANPNVTTVPSGFTTLNQDSSSQPSGGLFAARDKGLTLTTLAWGGASAVVYGAIGVELDVATPGNADAPPLIGGRGASR